MTALNCREGDLAMVRAPGRLAWCPLCRSNAVAVKPGTLVRVTRHDGFGWGLEETITGEVGFGCGSRVLFVCRSLRDELLIPIRDPGEDAVDQVLQRIGAPDYAPEVPRG